MMSAAIERSVGIETIPHLTPRDSTVMGLESCCSAGTPRASATSSPSPAIRPRSAIIRARGRLRARLDRAHAAHLPPERGRGLQRQVDRRADVVLPRRRRQPDRRRPRARDPRFRREGRRRRPLRDDADPLRSRAPRPLPRAELGGSSPVPLLVGLFPVWSYRLAQRLHNEVPGIVVPDELQQALLEAGAGSPDIGSSTPAACTGSRGRRRPASTSSRPSGSPSLPSTCSTRLNRRGRSSAG